MQVKKTRLPILWDELDEMAIDHALWGTTYTPKAWAKIAYIEHDAVYVNMFVEEKEPLATYTQAQDPVYQDSCLECFLNFDPNHQEAYFNFEMNANAAMLVGWGKDRHQREAVDCDFHPYVFKNERGWGVTLIIPEALILKYYDRIASTWKGNFYKCGDCCQPAHYLSWSPVEEEKPNFHAPLWFGTLKCEA